MEVEVYSDNIYSAVHEYGYKHVPARSYMRLTLSQETQEVVDIMDNEIGRTI
jgi:phage gpG-like protein